MRHWLMWIVAICFLIGGAVPVLGAENNKQLIIINKSTNKLAFFEDGKQVKVFSVGTGRKQSYTPEGTFKIVNKIKNRPYYTKKIPGGDPRNPLGDRWLGLNALGTAGDTYAIHGNSNEKSIGNYVSAGCVRMYNNEIRWLFDQVKVNTPVIITRSKLSFAEIAKANKYTVQEEPEKEAPLEKIDTNLTLLATTKLYTQPDLDHGTWHALSPQKVYAFEKKGNWYHVKTWYGDAWLTSKQLIVGDVKPVEQTITFDETLSIYENPLANSKILGSLAPQTVHAFEYWNDWYHINTWIGDVWVYAKDAAVQVPFEKVEPEQITETMKSWMEQNRQSEEPLIQEWDGVSYLFLSGHELASILETKEEFIVQTKPMNPLSSPYTLVKLGSWNKEKKIRLEVE